MHYASTVSKFANLLTIQLHNPQINLIFIYVKSAKIGCILSVCSYFWSMKKRLFLLAITLIVVDFAFGQGCSQCKLLAQQGSELDENSFGSSINSGILFLIAIPYLILMFFFRKQIARLFKRKNAKA